MDAATLEMVLTAYDETVQDALASGHGDGVAHTEGLTAAAMLLAAVTGVEDAAARAEVEMLDPRKRLAA
ncbi:hypothetical protein CCC_00530 [Paramagnetospirillum magnetotacticum MS-1]|uniref:Uncharacterized protein n=1 Tax=Paramagnetospirillum magnetotacticum MS-1 TaxID=272627 RepID=A0A0C2YCL1_PARME|nr:hypothetical protein [Paramagnetospirillum magnetotacticum]KIL97469.1 hypothetical protein CCC_00530 [Paramagnetospirillum magnetotacticum MS-1]